MVTIGNDWYYLNSDGSW
ncbi:MAG: hypothetical protein ACLR43_01990 [Faecalibacillus faecis]